MDELTTAPAFGKDIDNLDALLDEMEEGAAALETKAGISAPHNKAWPRSSPAGGDDVKAAVVAIGKEVLRQGQVIDRVAATAGATPSTSREAHERKMRAWNIYQEMLARKGQHSHQRDPLTRDALGRLDDIIDRMGAVEKRMRFAEVKADRPPGLASRYPGAGGQRRGGYLSAPMSLYQKAVRHHLLTGSELFHGQSLHDLKRAAYKAMHTEDSTAGGYLLLPERDTSPLATFLRVLSPMRQRATVRQILSDELEQATVSSVNGAYWSGERQDVQETSTPTVGLDKTPTMELRDNPKLTEKLLDDADFDIEAWLTEEIGTNFAEKESDAWFNGNGIIQPRGLLTYEFVAPANWAHGKFRYLPTGVSGGFLPTAPTSSPPTMPDSVLIDAIQALKQMHRQNASWLMNSASVGVVRKLRDDRGMPLWQANLVAGQPPTLLGYAIDEDEFMPDIGADTYAIGFGDWRRTYQIVDRLGIRVLRNPYKEPGWVHYNTRKRVGGAVRYFDAAIFLKFGTS